MVRLYTMKKCPFCDEMKKYLKEGDIEFMEIDVELHKNKLEFNKIVEISKADSVPILIVNKKILIPERSFKTIKEGFEKVKKLLEG